MESWLKRLKFYGFGFGLGLIFVFFFFKNRGCSWLPENRVKNAVLERMIVVSDETQVEMEAVGFSKDDLVQLLNDGDVLFSESNKEGESKVYMIEKEGKRYCFTLPKESFVSEFVLSDNPFAVTNSTEGEGAVVRMPLDSSFVYIETELLKDLSIDKEKQTDEFAAELSDEILEALSENGRIEFLNTDWEKKPKPTHRLLVNLAGEEGWIDAIWYKNKISIQSISRNLLEK